MGTWDYIGTGLFVFNVIVWLHSSKWKDEKKALSGMLSGIVLILLN